MTVPDELFNLFHRHRRLVRRRLANPLKCSCGGNLYTVSAADEDLNLRCDYCGEDTVPGEKTINKVRAIVKEHFLDD